MPTHWKLCCLVAQKVFFSIESRYEAVIAKLRAELTSLKTQAVDVATADSGRTFVHDTIPVPTIQRTAAAGGSGASEQLKGQIREKDKELQVAVHRSVKGFGC